MLQDSSAGLPTTLNGASITVAVGGVTTHPALYYTSSAQLAAVLPAATPVGNGTLTVNYRGANSAPAPIQVVASAIGINEYNQIPIPLGVLNTNVDLGVATDAVTGALLSFTNSGAPGQIITLWTTGLGADPADSDTTYSSTPHSVNTPLQIYVGGVLANILYQGSAGYPGVNQINLTIPASVTADCQVPLVAVTGNVISNVVVLPIHPGGGTCVKQGTGRLYMTGDQILKGTQDTIKAGSLTVHSDEFYERQRRSYGEQQRGRELFQIHRTPRRRYGPRGQSFAGQMRGVPDYHGRRDHRRGSGRRYDYSHGAGGNGGRAASANGPHGPEWRDSGGQRHFGGRNVHIQWHRRGGRGSVHVHSDHIDSQFQLDQPQRGCDDRPDAGGAVYLDRRSARDLRSARRNLDGVGGDGGLFVQGAGGSPPVHRALLYSARPAAWDRRCFDTTA